MISTNEWRLCGDQVGARRIEGPQGGKVLRQIRDEQLEEVLRRWQVLEPMLTQVPQFDLPRERGLNEGAGRVRDQDLAPVAGRADARGAVHVHPGVVITAQQ